MGSVSQCAARQNTLHNVYFCAEHANTHTQMAVAAYRSNCQGKLVWPLKERKLSFQVENNIYFMQIMNLKILRLLLRAFADMLFWNGGPHGRPQGFLSTEIAAVICKQEVLISTCSLAGSHHLLLEVWAGRTIRDHMQPPNACINCVRGDPSS